jgi:cytochrome oxidase assembly protein ShyY1
MRSSVYRFLLSRRWLSLMLVALLAVPACVALGQWQLDRLHRAQARNHRLEANSGATPVELASLTTVGGQIGPDRQWRAVLVKGHYDDGHTLLVRNRTQGGAAGFQVLTPLVTDSGSVALVDRGWLALPDGGGLPLVPKGPDGEVQVSGLLRPTETQPSRGPHDAADVPTGQVVRIDVPRIARTLPYPVYAGYVDLRTQQPPAPVVDGSSSPDPDPLPGSETEMLHRAYAWQWFVFAAIVPFGVAMLARREAIELAEAPVAVARREGVRTPPAPGG